MSYRTASASSRKTARLVFAGLLAAALTAAAPGLGAAQETPVGTASTELSGPTVTLFPAQLERGDATPLLHIEEEVIVEGDLRIPVRGPAHLWLMGRIGRDYLVTTAGEKFERYTVQLVRRDGHRRVLQRFGDRTMATMSADGRHLALTTLAGPGTKIRIVRTRSGELVRARTFASYGVEVSDYGRRRLVITGLRSRTYWWNPVRNRVTLIVPRPATAHIPADRLVVLVPDPDTPYLDCQKTVKLSRPTEVVWRSCRNIPLNFSPDARRMVTVDIQADGIGPRQIQVRGARGHLVQTYQAPMWFGFTEWETDTDLLLQPVGKRYLAAVRCTLGNGCERASRLYRAPRTFDPPETMRWSFPQ